MAWEAEFVKREMEKDGADRGQLVQIFVRFWHACGWISGISSRKLESEGAYPVLFGQRP